MPMPTVKQTEEFYDMLVAAARKKRVRLAHDGLPANLGMPSEVEANGGDYTHKLIDALHTWALAELSPDLQSKLNTLIEDNTDPRGAVAKDASGKDRDVELASQAAEILRRNNIDEAMVSKIIRKDFGVGPAALAQDSARRERNRERDAANYRKMFPHAPANSGEATAPRPRERARDPESYFKMFPGAARLG